MTGGHEEVGVIAPGERVLRIIASEISRYKVEVTRGEDDNHGTIRKVYMPKEEVDPELIVDWRGKREARAARKEAKRKRRSRADAPAQDPSPAPLSSRSSSTPSKVS